MEKILIVDDVKLLREIQKGLLAPSPVHILTAGDGQEALTVTRKELPNLIIMDNHMPIMDGVTCCREIKTDPLMQHIPVIMLSNAVNTSDLAGYRAAGADEFLSKPIDSRLFLATIKKYLPAVECRGIRVPYCAEIRLVGDDGFHVGMAKDISLQGIHVTSEFQPMPGEEIRFGFMLPGSVASTEVRGKVAWVRKKHPNNNSGLNAEFGVEFIEVTGQGIPFLRKSELESFLAQHAGAVGTDSVKS